MMKRSAESSGVCLWCWNFALNKHTPRLPNRALRFRLHFSPLKMGIEAQNFITINNPEK